ncbi:RHS repeat-associated core domain-containing protein [Chryseobacterium soldanellicola]|uniref:RHS repeat-associated core domain-containing protein n=1 Tax=Chryseobacterium soldanellicola TaxID=311333 RepID=A0A1H1AM97_9FLAO|nr:DUF6443 domain-containing protein [Chryseobacterium soldanellicola]SDQ40764.1 RHS repeat-associated core domain-containing protein [Chryseobacterium soldanellicola]
MKKIIIPIGALLITSLAHAQNLPTTENYIQSRTYLEPVTTSSSTAKQINTVQYFDGLGRPKQIVNVKASPTGKDVVTHIEYDGFGRQIKDFLPIPQSGTQNGGIYTSPLGNISAIYGGEKIFSEKILENSPLDRIQQQIQVGNDWSNKPVKFSYDANTVADRVRKFTTATIWENGATKSTLGENWLYTDAQLYKNSVKDEDGNETIEFKNGQGQTILVRKVIANNEYADTYYIYNEYNQLAFVIPPLASIRGDIVSNTTKQDELCYIYRYDGKSRLVEKKIPGKGWEYMAYDKQDRLVATQDAELRNKGQWLYTKYDQFGRVAITGIGTGASRIAEQNIIDGLGSNNVARVSTAIFNRQGIDVYYENPDSTYPNSSKWVTILSLNYYDTYPNYSFNPAFPSTIFGSTVITDNPANSGGISIKSLPVMTLVKNIEDDNWTKNYIYYDTKGRAIGTYSINHLGGYTKTESELDFAGVTKKAITRHKRLNTDTEKVITENFEYDNQNRLLVHKHQVDSNPEEILAQNKYNELSQLESKKAGGTSTATPLQIIDYKYNIRGWMTKINDPANLNGKLFGYELKYNNPVNTSLSIGKHNGNIAEVDWRTSNDNVLKRYSYQYDPLNRLLNGLYSEPNSFVPENHFFSESLEYDINGNMSKLYRNSKNANGLAEQIDRLTYTYLGNQLTSVADGSTNYKGYPDVSGNTIAYDDNGNMKDQKDKGILQIRYNYLNLPNYLQFDRQYFTRNQWQNENVYNFYRADGIKLKKEHRYSENAMYTKKTTEYLDGFQYEEIQNVNLSTLKFVPTSEGYYNFENNKYIYNYTDHLGNIRLSYFNNGSGAEVLEENNYYPFGLKHEGYNVLTGNPAYKYQYNGKELQQESGMYDYGARMYMPDLGRWGVVDPLAEKMPSWSPYAYAFDNPVRFGDPTGMAPDDFVQRKDGSIYWDKNANSQASTKAGETYLGKTLEFKFTSYIDGKLWDGPRPPAIDPAGVKLTSTLTLTGRENAAGELTSLVGDFESKPGKTPIGKPRDYYPGEGGSNNTFDMKTTSTGINVNFEQHASVSPIEEIGLNLGGYKIVDVAQKLNVNYNSSSGNLSVNAYTNIFPSANVTVNGSKIMQYNQPSFNKTHLAPYNSVPVSGARAYDFSYYPSRFYKRN